MATIDEDKVRARLEARAKELQTRRDNLRRSDEGMLDSELADYDQHPADEGTETFEQEIDQTTDVMLEDDAKTVALALQRLDEGKYGICVDCGEEIEPARLDAVPEAVRCIKDQRRYEGELRARFRPRTDIP